VDSHRTDSAVAESEQLTRFLLDKRDFDLIHRTVKPRAFIPWYSRERSSFEHSVFRTETLTEDETWKAGIDVAQQRGLGLLGRADLAASQVYDLGLAVHVDEPPPYHACIVGWPAGEDGEAAAARKLLAQQLAATARLVLVLRAA
jgi:hypothetical protein